MLIWKVTPYVGAEHELQLAQHTVGKVKFEPFTVSERLVKPPPVTVHEDPEVSCSEFAQLS